MNAECLHQDDIVIIHFNVIRNLTPMARNPRAMLWLRRLTRLYRFDDPLVQRLPVEMEDSLV